MISAERPLQTYPINGEVQVILLEKELHHTQVSSHDSIVEWREGGLWRERGEISYGEGRRGERREGGEKEIIT